MTQPRVAVIGAGAAGLLAAVAAAEAGASVLLCEGTPDGGRKILISGGGRCNILPMVLDPARYVTASSPHTLRKILRSWPLEAQRTFFEREVGLPLVDEPESAKVFPASHKARDVRDGLLRLAATRGVQRAFGRRVAGLEPLPVAAGAPPRWRVLREGEGPLEVDRVIVATGGLSVPQTGSDGQGLRWLAALGHLLHPAYAALTPITAEPSSLGPFGALAGISLDVEVRARNAASEAVSRRGFLFTHRGFSGPSLLDVSHVVTRVRTGVDTGPAELRVRWTPDRDEAAWTAALAPQGTRTVGGALRERLPQRLAEALLERAAVPPGTVLAQLPREARRRVLDELLRCALPWHGDEGYKKAEVTGGGVALGEVDPGTLESRRTPGLHICGEALDAFGPIGGFNFVWAWVTGRAAGRGAAAAGG